MTEMLGYDDLVPDQIMCIDRLYECDSTFLIAAMGSGKTVCTLTALSELLANGAIAHVLVVAPLQVCLNVWATEHEHWAHLQDLDVAVCVGTEAQRLGQLNRRAQVTVINYENLAWWVKQPNAKGMFDGLVIDELSKLRSSGGTQFKHLRRRLKDFSWRVGLTGTPVEEDWTGLFGMCLILDDGERLGTVKDKFLRRYFYATDYNEYNWELHEFAAPVIVSKLKDLVYTLPDYRNTLPALNLIDVPFAFLPSQKLLYDELNATGKLDFYEHDQEHTIHAPNEAVLSGKLSQLACGFLYDSEVEGAGDVIEFDSGRVARCVNLVGDVLTGALSGGVVLCYWFSADRTRLLAALKARGLRVGEIGGGVSSGAVAGHIKAWNACELDVLLLHPRSAGHGLNLAAGGCNIVWYSPVWSRDLWLQTNARLWRRGQVNDVNVYSLICAGSIDEIMVQRVGDKSEHDRLLREHLGIASPTWAVERGGAFEAF